MDNVGGGQTDGVSLEIRQAADNTVMVPGLRQVRVQNMEDVINVFSKGSSNRATASTNLNEDSSRSHLIIQMDVLIEIEGESDVRGKLYLVDLAGSERVGKSGATGMTMKEAQYINRSLLALGDVMEALDQKQKHIPYR
jgi:kinesin family member C2/C3